jgi:hypothetical protein
MPEAQERLLKPSGSHSPAPLTWDDPGERDGLGGVHRASCDDASKCDLLGLFRSGQDTKKSIFSKTTSFARIKKGNKYKEQRVKEQRKKRNQSRQKQRRKPMKLRRLPGSTPLRKAERQCSGKKFQEPPRSTRYCPSFGPCGSITSFCG